MNLGRSNVYCMVQKSPECPCPWLSGLVWRDPVGEWHSASFGSDIYTKIVSMVPTKECPDTGDRYWLVPDVPACPEHFRTVVEKLVCYPETQCATFLPSDWLPVLNA